MKTIYPIALLALAASITACTNEEENIFDQSAAERLNAVSGIYSQRLTDSKGGWVMEYYPYGDNEDPVTGYGYLIMNRFHDNGSVYTLMRNSASRNTVWEDSTFWEVITDMGPVLTYDTYNRCIGVFSDPDNIPRTSSDESGKGYQGDYEFVMVDVPEGGQHIMLKGKKRGLYQRLTRVPEGTDFVEYLNDIDNFKSKFFVQNARWELIMTDNGKRYRLNHQDEDYSLIYPEGSDSVTYGIRDPFLVIKYDDRYHLRYKDTIMVDGQQMEQEFFYNPELDIFQGKVNPENTIESYPVGTFFDEYLAEKGLNYVDVPISVDMSEKFKTYIDALVADFATMKSNRGRAYAYVGLRLQWDARNDSYQWQVRYTPGTSTATFVRYNYGYVYNDSHATFSYVAPGVDDKGSDASSTNVRNTLPAVVNILDLLSQEFVIAPASTAFNLFNIKLTSVTDPDLWFVANIN